MPAFIGDQDALQALLSEVRRRGTGKRSSIWDNQERLASTTRHSTADKREGPIE
jgi:hypothetical protein